MVFLHAFKLGGIWVGLLLSDADASHLRPGESRNGHPRGDGLHLQIASDPPVRCAVDTLDCVSGESEKALKRNTRMNSETGNVEMMGANALVAGRAQELRREAKLHEQRAQELEGIKRTQKNRHHLNMKDIQKKKDQAEISRMEHDLELLKEAESSATKISFKRELNEEKHLLNEAQTYASASRAMRLQQHNSKQQHKSRDEVAALIQYPLLGFSLPSPVNPIEYLTKYSTEAAPSFGAGSRARSAVQLPARSERGEFAGKTNHQPLRDRLEILGDEAAVEELEEKKKTTNASKRRDSKKSSCGPCKGECNIGKTSEDRKAEHDEDEKGNNSASSKGLHKAKRAVTPPLRSDEGAFFRNSSEDEQVSEFEGSMEDFDAEESASAVASPKNAEKDDDNEDGEEGSSGSAGFNEKSAPASGTTKNNDSKGDEDESSENRQEEEAGAATTSSEHKAENGKANASKSPVEATAQEADQAKNLQQPQGIRQQHSFYHVKPLDGPKATWLSSPYRSSDIYAAVETARLRFGAARKAAASSSAVNKLDAAVEHGMSKFVDEDEQQISTSELGGAQNTEGIKSREGPPATEEVGNAEGISAAEEATANTQASLENDYKLFAAAEEAQQAKNGLKACAQGSFLGCRQGQIRRAHLQPPKKVTSPQ